MNNEQIYQQQQQQGRNRRRTCGRNRHFTFLKLLAIGMAVVLMVYLTMMVFKNLTEYKLQQPKQQPKQQQAYYNGGADSNTSHHGNNESTPTPTPTLSVSLHYNTSDNENNESASTSTPTLSASLHNNTSHHRNNESTPTPTPSASLHYNTSHHRNNESTSTSTPSVSLHYNTSHHRNNESTPTPTPTASLHYNTSHHRNNESTSTPEPSLSLHYNTSHHENNESTSTSTPEPSLSLHYNTSHHENNESTSTPEPSLSLQGVPSEKAEGEDALYNFENGEDLFSSSTVGALQNLHMAFIGDSLTRFQYMSFVYYLLKSRWAENDQKPSAIYGEEGKGWDDYYAMAWTLLEGAETCDCFRPNGNYRAAKRLQQMYENRYYRHVERNNYITMIQKFGHFEAHGHWHPSEVYDSHHAVNISNPDIKGRKFAWRYKNWDDIVRFHLAKLDPKPTIIVFNSGMWPHDLLLNASNVHAIRRVLDENDIVGIYKTTTKTRSDIATTTDSYEEDACRILHHCLNLSWTGTLSNNSDFRDNKHFSPSVNRIFNEQLIEIIAKINHTSNK